MLKRVLQPKKGATLLEFMIYLAIVSFVLVAAAGFAYEFVQTQAKATAIEEVTQNGKYALARIATEVREASGINTGSSVFGTNPGTLSLATSTGGTNPTMFAVGGTTLNITQGTGETMPLISSRAQVVEFVIEDLTVTGKTKIVRIKLTLKYANPANIPALNVSSTFETTARVHKGDGFGP